MVGGHRIKVIVPIPMDVDGVANRAAQHPAHVIAPGFKPEFCAVKWGAALGDSYHDILLVDWTVFQAGIDAEEEGYSAVVIDTVSDSGLPALRSRLSIPALRPGECAFHIAMTLGKKFTVLSGHDGKITQLLNASFWRTRGGKSQEVCVYFSDENVLV